MERKTIRCTLTGDTCEYIKHPSGLDIYVCEMPGFSTAEAQFATRYGSNNNTFRTADGEFCSVPEGIAHFLEHKLFENEDGDTFARYAKTGACANAYTSVDRTNYYFSCSANFNDSLKILLEFVQDPYFTKESVEKELGIIGQEIRMVNDNPGSRCFNNLMKALYKNHPIKIDVIGTEESIAKITPELLYQCYNAFYNLGNMVLIAVGNVRTDEVLAVCDEYLKPCTPVVPELCFPEEPKEVVRDEISAVLPVGQPIFMLGFKLPPRTGEEDLRASLLTKLVTDVLTDESSPLYASLLEDGLLNASFGTEIFSGDGFSTLLISGESKNPQAVRERIQAEIVRAAKEGLDRDHFNRTKKVNYGSSLRALNNVESVGEMLFGAYMERVAPFTDIDMLAELTYEDAQSYLETVLAPAPSALSVILPETAKTEQEENA